jgi:signal transduction histidine kinase
MVHVDPYGAKTTVVSINALKSGTGFTHTMFPDTSENSTSSVPKLVYMKPVDDTWWIGSGIYGVQVL